MGPEACLRPRACLWDGAASRQGGWCCRSCSPILARITVAVWPVNVAQVVVDQSSSAGAGRVLARIAAEDGPLRAVVESCAVRRRRPADGEGNSGIEDGARPREAALRGPRAEERGGCCVDDEKSLAVALQPRHLAHFCMGGVAHSVHGRKFGGDKRGAPHASQEARELLLSPQ
eukprot:scaffold118711_cov28-Tisochrysis_lutea.AAC.2